MCRQLQTLRLIALLISVLLVWNILITSYVITQNIKAKEDKLNKQICIEELIPVE